jgi:amino acid transporter
MEAFDPFGLIEWIYDSLEDRYGRVVAWLVSFAAALAMAGVLVGILIYLASS